MIDLHLHTTASDGLLSPAALVERAAAAGLTVISLTDHDTVAGIDEARAAADRLRVRLIPGIEVTAVVGGRDVHILGYFIDPDSPALGEFLEQQRTDRVRRVREMGARLEALGYRIDVEALLGAAAGGSRSVGRPAIADALAAAGLVTNRDEAFGTLLGRGKPAFVPRAGVTPARVLEVIHEAGGIASMAHPGVTGEDSLIPQLVGAGLDAIEVWHSDHTPEDSARYDALAADHGLARSGGSDYHGDGLHRACRLGAITIPPAALELLIERAGQPR